MAHASLQQGITYWLFSRAQWEKGSGNRMAKILEAIYEPIFRGCSYGFRPGRSCHTAVAALLTHLHDKGCEIVIDVDLKNFFGQIQHDILLGFLIGQGAQGIETTTEQVWVGTKR